MLMSEPTKKRRRWPWLILAPALLLLGGSLAWNFRPLNATESALVGSWREAPAGDVVFHFEANRRYSLSLISGKPGGSRGSWCASPGMLELRTDDPYWRFTWSYFKQKLIYAPTRIRFDGPNRLWYSRIELVRIPPFSPTDR